MTPPSLPFDILEDMVFFLKDDLRLLTLQRTSLVHSTFRKVCLPKLFGRISIHLEQHGQNPSERLLDLIENNPLIARYIHTFTMEIPERDSAFHFVKPDDNNWKSEMDALIAALKVIQPSCTSFRIHSWRPQVKAYRRSRFSDSELRGETRGWKLTDRYEPTSTCRAFIINPGKSTLSRYNVSRTS
jgi:hypothetical protein